MEFSNAQAGQGKGAAISAALAGWASVDAAAIDEVASRWVWVDPSAAIGWAAGIPEAGRMQSTMHTAMGSGTRTDPAAARD